MNIFKLIADDMKISEKQVLSVSRLFEEGATVPFIARYRKEATGELNEVEIQSIKDLLEKYIGLEKRKESILKSLEDNGFITEELKKTILNCSDLSELEDIYLPYKPKRKTRGVKAREAGLEPLSNMILKGESFNLSDFVCGDIKSDADALNGAKDIIAEVISEDSRVRGSLRDKFIKKSIISSKVVKSKTEEAEKFRDYFDFQTPLSKAPSHRILAILRGVSNGFLRFKIDIDEEEALNSAGRLYSKGIHREIIEEAVSDSYKRLLQPSLETEMKNRFKIEADEKAVDVFKENLRELLLAPPLGEKNILAIDPGLRTGSKVVCINKQGKLMVNRLIKPLPPHNRVDEAEKTIKALCREYNVEAISVGNGTGGREMEDFCNSLNLDIPVIMTNESGASIYSASECAREEFPDLDLTIRGAVSIGRRLMDPLAELVKIDPKSIGVGQYQHDVDQAKLKKSLEETVVSCVNSVGVELNTASKELLSHVAGLNISRASNIVEYRDSVGGFKTRGELLKVKGVGEKVYEQAAGFLRVRNSPMILDRSSVHPESYSIVEDMAADMDVSIDELIKSSDLRKKIRPEKYISDKAGLPTIKDILLELSKPGRDPRESFTIFQFDKGVKSMEDLAEGLSLPGVITNVTAFGAFVDIGVHQDGLVHISQLSNSFVSDPSTIVKVGQKVRVRVLEVDIKRKRISLSMKE